MFLNPSKIGMGTHIYKNLKFGKNVHDFLKNQEMSRILKYFNPIQIRRVFRDPQKVFVRNSQSFWDNSLKFGDFS